MIDGEVPALELSFGQFIQEARVARNLTQAQVANLAHTTQTHLSKIELGKVDPTLTLALAICTALNIDINDYAQQQHT